MDKELLGQLADLIEATRVAERAICGALDAEHRDAHPSDGSWSPKDVQAHVTVWKARQAARLESLAQGTVLPGLAEGEFETINAREQAKHADWSWEAVVAEADQTTRRLADLVRACEPGPALDPLLDGIISNGSAHPIEHLAAIAQPGAAERQLRELDTRLTAFASQDGMPVGIIGVTLYNQACRHALAGRLDAAREILPVAFGHRPDLVEWARQDTDIEALWPELDALAAQ